MDCEKFESTLIDELYDELDELTSAATKRHVAGCARCASLLGGLRATRRIAVLPPVEVPPGLEERILAAARDAQKVVPIGSRVQRAVSWAGSWAMRPQTAMAAVFLLMIGSSVLLLRQHAKPSASSGMTVSEQGAPAMAGSAAPPAAADEAVDLRQAAAAHGAIEPKTLSTATAAPLASALALGDPSPPQGTMEEQLGVASKPYADDKGSAAESALGSFGELKDQPPRKDGVSSNAGTVAGAPQRSTGRSAAAPVDEMARNARPASPPPPPMAQAAPAAAPVAAGAQSQSQAQGQARGGPGGGGSGGGADFASGMDSYRSRNYADAIRTFDTLGNAGDANASLWSARSVRESSGCAAAVTRFDQVAARSYGTQPGYDATLEGGRCYKALGSFEAARTRFARLLTVPTHKDRAQVELDAMSPKAAAAQAARRPAIEAAPPATQQQQQKPQKQAAPAY